MDADILILASDLAVAESMLEKAGFEKKGPLAVGGSTWMALDGRPLDLLASDQSWVAEALDTAITDAEGFPYISLPYLVLMKLRSGRMQDLADITRMVGAADNEALAQTRDVVRKHAPADLEDLDSMIRLGKMEYE